MTALRIVSYFSGEKMGKFERDNSPQINNHEALIPLVT